MNIKLRDAFQISPYISCQKYTTVNYKAAFCTRLEILITQGNINLSPVKHARDNFKACSRRYFLGQYPLEGLLNQPLLPPELQSVRVC